MKRNEFIAAAASASTLIGDARFKTPSSGGLPLYSPKPIDQILQFSVGAGIIVGTPTRVDSSLPRPNWTPPYNVIVKQISVIGVQQTGTTQQFVDSFCSIGDLSGNPAPLGAPWPQGFTGGSTATQYPGQFLFWFGDNDFKTIFPKGLFLKGGSSYDFAFASIGSFTAADSLYWNCDIFWEVA